MGGTKGFSLVEVMVGLVLMTIGVLSMAALSVTVARSNRGATAWTRADQILHEKIEEFQTAPYDEIVAGADTVLVGGVEYVRTWEITDDTPRANVKQIDIEGAWVERGDTVEATRTTYMAESGR